MRRTRGQAYMHIDTLSRRHWLAVTTGRLLGSLFMVIGAILIVTLGRAPDA